MGSKYLTDMADVLRRAGLTVVEVGGAPSQVGSQWKSRGRGSGGYDSGRPTCIMVHHTASSATVSGWGDANYCTFSSSNKPVCNLLLGRDSKWYVCAGGATNTNGSGRGCSRCPPDSMNTHAIGIEASNNGTGETWSVAMQDSYVRGVAALQEHYMIPNDHIHSHQFYAPDRKIDPAGPARFVNNQNLQWETHGGMNKFRAEVKAIADGGGPQPPDEEDEVAYKFIRETNSAGNTWMSSAIWGSDLKNKWCVNLTPDMYAAFQLECAAKGWDITVYKASSAQFPGYGSVSGPTPNPPAGKKYDGWGRLVSA